MGGGYLMRCFILIPKSAFYHELVLFLNRRKLCIFVCGVLEGRNYLCDELLDRRLIVPVGCVVEVFKVTEKRIIIELYRSAYVYFFVVCLGDALFIQEQLLIELFTGTQTCIFYLDILVRLVARKPDKIFGKYLYLDRLAV